MSARQSHAGTRGGRTNPDRRDDGNVPENPVRDELENILLGRDSRSVSSVSFQIPDPPHGNPMNFGRWKEQVYMAVSQAATSRNEDCLKWIIEVENATTVQELVEAEPFVQSDNILRQLLTNKMTSITHVQYLNLKSSYLTQGRMVKGRQMLWLLFQCFQVDRAALALHKSQQLRNIKIGKNLPAFLNAWQEHIESMEVKPSDSEKMYLFLDQVKKFPPLAETWKYLDQGLLRD